MRTLADKLAGTGEASRYNLAFAVLALATVFMWLAGEHTGRGIGAALGLLAIAFIKGRIVIREFMGLRRVKRKWRALMLGWLLLVLGLITFAYWCGIA
jgi:preprotein translocase subunit SecY